MGRHNLEGMLEVADRDTTLAWHLQSNHYPPVPLSMIPACKEAIAAVESGKRNKAIKLPDGVMYKDTTTAPAYAIVEQHHLDGFLQGDDNA